MAKTIRYQAAILRGSSILLVLHREHNGGRSYWLLPGGSREEGESEEECVVREMMEETSLDVRVERLLMDELVEPGVSDARRKTYLCTIQAGEARPGYEPEPEVAARYAIAEVGWYNLRREDSWGEQVITDRFTYPEMKKLQELLGF
jgi:8-oxo-dGTP diphosphatase